MDKRTSHIASCVTPEMEIAVKAIAHLDGLTVSDLINKLLIQHVEEKRNEYLRLNSVFGIGQDL
ncbi:hypothetical protein HUU62_08755 [Rhodoferax sp. 4810]|uniref:Uncharacterized protein n=1 Tax=Thiospirillum jenense TaxID=1653858 RepID=A0A839HEB7_9GAMM|nr:hypothetical protein [Thiospirillum jenense]MBB1074499.1 hypothetical protein [Rhodoferax jenense]MBB1125517.1 hypothetical protein [Thiospirillum jenense]